MAACVGSIIRLGILRTPGEIAKVVSDPWLYLGWWFGGGLFVLMTLLFVGELMSMTRKSGGVYSLISRAFGRFPSFVIGWIDWVSFSATMALKAVVAAEYLAILLPSLAPHVTVLALFITSAFATLQLAGTRVSASIQETASAGIGLVIAILACALFYGAMASTGPIEVASASGSVESLGIMAFGLVAASIIFTYDGWAGPSYFCGEVRSGGHGVVKGSIQGFLVVMVLYMLLNVALVLSVPLTSIGGNDLAMAKALNLLFGSSVETVLIVAAVFILLAHQNLNYMMTSRIIYALSQDGLGSEKATVVADNGAPVGAVILSWILVCILIAVGSFEFLLKLTVSLLLIAYVAMVLGVFRLRRSEPNAERPFVASYVPQGVAKGLVIYNTVNNGGTVTITADAGSGITDTLGAGLILSGLSLLAGWSLITVKLIAVFFFLLITSPTSTHALARAALAEGVQPKDASGKGDAPSST